MAAVKGFSRLTCRLPRFSLRAIIETINSMIKRKMGDTIYGKSVFTIGKETQFTIIAHNMRLLLETGWVI